jgi:hypothetical protein
MYTLCAPYVYERCAIVQIIVDFMPDSSVILTLYPVMIKLPYWSEQSTAFSTVTSIQHF